MKKCLFLSLFVFVIYSCGKSANKPVVITIANGNYAAYKSVDTGYVQGIPAKGISVIDMYSIYGDTIYYNPGTPEATIFADTIKNYNPAKRIPNDTIIIQSATSGLIHVQQTFDGFSYDLSTGKFDNNSTDSNIKYKLLKTGSNTIELVSHLLNIYTGELSGSYALYFRKVN